MYAIMASVKQMRLDVKKYIETADENVVKMVHALLKEGVPADWWNTMPDSVREGVEKAVRQAENGEVMVHEEVRKKYAKWFAE
ncbi:MAG: hypothetical protein ACO1NW_02460 [Chitinophagaceae bacterium]